VYKVKIKGTKMADENISTKRKLSEDEEKEGTEQVAKKIKYSEKEAGTLLFAGLYDYDDRNTKPPKLVKWAPNRFEALENVRIRDISTGPVSYFFYAISDEGKVYSWGFNQKGQLGVGDMKNRLNPTLITDLNEHNVVAVATGRQHGLLLTDDGVVFACGENKSGQCGVGNKKETLTNPQRIDYAGSAIIKIACGGDFSLILNEDGEVYSFGLPEYGQTGHGSNNMEIAGRKEVYHCVYSPTIISVFVEVDSETNEKTFHNPKISQIACGVNHSIVIDEDKRLFTWGFGGYGRLGHNNTKDEYFPRLMKCWYRITGRADGGITNVICGGQFNMVHTTVAKCTLMFGQLHRNAEANMYPKFLDDLSGWDVRHVACNQSGWIACADDKVIACQPSPCYGTMAMGEKQKSSAQPKIVTTLKDVYVYRTGMGYMHSVYIARCDTDSDKKALEKFPSMQFDDSKEKVISEAPVKKGRPATKKRGGKK